MLLYGAYAVLFGFYVHVLCRGEIKKNRFLDFAIIALFLLSTAHMALMVADRATVNEFGLNEFGLAVLAEAEHIASEVEFSPQLIPSVANAIYVTSNVIADSIFIFRCYAIWGFRRVIIILPILCTIVVAGSGYLNVSGSGAEAEEGITGGVDLLFLSISISLVTTVLLMGLSAGRICWLARKAGKIMGRKTTKRYYTVCAMILESGALYGVGALTLLVLDLYTFNSQFTSGVILGQLVGIAPTIIAVRVGLGKSVESVDSFVTMAPPRPRLQPPLDFQSKTTHSIEQQVIYLRPESSHGGGIAESV